MRNPAHRALHVSLRTLDTRPIEVVYCFLTVAWGISLVWPGDAFKGVANFAAMSYVMPDWGWGCLAILTGAVRTYGVLYDVLRARLAASLGGGVIWSFVWTTMLLSNSMSTGVAVYGVLSLVNLMVFIKLCRVYGEPHGGIH